MNGSFWPSGYIFRQSDGHVLIYKLEENEISISQVTDSIRIDWELRVQFFFKRAPVPLPKWFCDGRDCRLSCKSMIEKLTAYLRLWKELYFSVFEEFHEHRFKIKNIQETLYGLHYYLVIHQFCHKKCYWGTSPYHFYLF